MTPELARAIAKDLNQWLEKIRIEFAMQGEPLLNKDYLEIFSAFKEEFPKCQIMVTSNMDVMKRSRGFDLKKLRKLFLAGVNILVADYYGEPNDMSYNQFYNGLKDSDGTIPVYDFYKHHPKVWAYVGSEVAYIVSIDNTNQRDFFRSMNNQAGNLDPKFGYDVGELPMMKRCHLPFREMAIKYDGAVAMCCMDWQREGIMGKFPTSSYKQIWNNQAYNMVRNLLYDKRRDLLSPCKRCNYHPVKVGLIQKPDNQDEIDLNKVAEQFSNYQNQTIELSNRYAKKPFKYKVFS